MKENALSERVVTREGEANDSRDEQRNDDERNRSDGQEHVNGTHIVLPERSPCLVQFEPFGPLGDALRFSVLPRAHKVLLAISHDSRNLGRRGPERNRRSPACSTNG